MARCPNITRSGCGYTDRRLIILILCYVFSSNALSLVLHDLNGCHGDMQVALFPARGSVATMTTVYTNNGYPGEPPKQGIIALYA
jgi:hypothetical protein